MINNLNEGDFRSRLDGCYCRYDDYPVKVSANEAGQISIIGLHAKSKIDYRDWKSIKPRDPRFDISSIPLGYCNTSEKVVYLTRIPHRNWKQGITDRNVQIVDIDGETPKRVQAFNVFTSLGFQEMVLGNNIPLEAVINTLKNYDPDNPKSKSEMAISPDIALQMMKHKIINVYFKTALVGWLSPLENYSTVHIKNEGKSWIISKYLSSVNWIVD